MKRVPAARTGAGHDSRSAPVLPDVRPDEKKEGERMNHGGTQNFTDIKLDRMQQHPSVQAIRIGRTKPYECSYPVMVKRPRIKERSKDGKSSRD